MTEQQLQEIHQRWRFAFTAFWHPQQTGQLTAFQGLSDEEILRKAVGDLTDLYLEVRELRKFLRIKKVLEEYEHPSYADLDG
jgi:hypothetical protein